MESWELENYLRNSTMDYSLKVTRYLYGVARTPCPNCPFKNENPPVSLAEKTEKCFRRCKFKIIIWILNPEQIHLYERVRPPERKREDIEAAINLGKTTQIENIIKESREIEISSPSFFKLRYNKNMPGSENSTAIMFYYVYIIQSMKNKDLYVGFTTSLKKRLQEHNRGLNFSTKPYRPWKLIHFEAYINKSDAKRREDYLKTSQGSRVLKRMLKEYFHFQKSKNY